MVSWKTISDICLITLTTAVLANYLIQRTEYLESYFEYKMDQCRTDAEKIRQLEKWDSNDKYDIPPFKSQQAWSSYWFIFRERAFQKYGHVFPPDYVPPHLQKKIIMLTEGGKRMIFE